MSKWMKSFVLVSAAALVLSACSNGGSKSDDTATKTDTEATSDATATDTQKADDAEADPAATTDVDTAEASDMTFPKSAIDPNISGEVTFWTFLDNKKNDETLTKAFNEAYPNIKLKTVFVPFDDLHNKLQTTLAAGKGAPDVALVEQGQFPRYSTGGVLTNLLDQPFDAGKYKEYVSEYNWNRWSSIDGTQLLGMPWDVTPSVTYYRSDIFEELGLPSDPDELGEYIQDPDQYFELAQTLKANNKYSLEWRDSPVHWFGDMYGYFDKDLNWVRNNDDFVKFLDISKKVTQLKIAPHDGLYSDKGKQRVKKGESVMYVAGTYGARDLAANFPDLKGKWKTTKAPFGLDFGFGGSTFVIPAQSQNKEAAFAFAEWITTSEAAWKIEVEQSVQPDWKNITELDWYKNHTNEYLGGQNDFAFYSSLTADLPVRRYTTLDGLAWPLWVGEVLNAIDKNVDSKTAIAKAQENIEKKLKPEIDKLKKQLQG
ncbi:hypothetical protein PCCS19_56800 [Paenibacillus sp. CCS19]|uniref:ABC transporter substrate-binding protein n=1 Tax=Paenibacillus sp. CCS19 TaxID=3158387 RepID=UPI0025684290|nr:extracellular solute-binding protein [Paenibacillus cellulosilyticus]GMK42620.1 hypothetical protein PCCS19_56800 [Paenibacillus cellulosilyticus]